MKRSKFNPDLIRQYMAGSDVLGYGIDYYMCEDAKRTEAEATELAYAYAIRFCNKKCSRSRDTEAGCEQRAYAEFVEKVQDGELFCTEERRKALQAQGIGTLSYQRKKETQKIRLQQQENERRRVAELREQCMAKGLDFEKENIRQLKRQYRKQNFLTFIAFLFYLPTLLLMLACVLFFIVFRGMAPNFDLELPYVIAIVAALASWVPGFLIMRNERKWLPDEAFEPIGKYKKKQESKHA